MWNRAVLESKPTKQVYPFEPTLAIDHQLLDCERSMPEPARMHQLSSPGLLAKWAKTYREQV